MARFLLIRHAAVELAANIIGGRSPGVHLSTCGHEQARRLTITLRSETIGSIYASPRERARETAQWIAEERRMPVEIAPELDEIDYGDWTGLSMEQLSARPHWQAFNAIRSCTRIPGGELISEVQARVATLIERLHAQHGAGSVLLISHCDVIRAALAYYLSLPLDLMLRLEIDPSSVSIVKLTAAGPSIECVNYTENLPSAT
ncbi:MAG: histidine phosphatase family protein [Candidatus Binatia bacterium]